MNDSSRTSPDPVRAHLLSGMTVYDSAGEMVGTVDAESLVHDYLTLRQSAALPHDVFVPLESIRRVEPDGVYLKLSRRALRGKRYATPPQAKPGPAVASAAMGAPDTTQAMEDAQASRIAVPLAAEELVARRTPVREGTVRLHKGVETREQAIAVPVTHDEVIVEHISPDQLDANAQIGANELLIPIMEEQVVVQKRMVLKEYVRVRKRQVVEQRQVRTPVRREVLSVQEQRSAAVGSDQPAWPLVREMQGPGAGEMPGPGAEANTDAAP